MWRARMNRILSIDKRLTCFAGVAAVVLATVATPLAQQVITGRNVNMVSGTKWPDGDPYLQRQNEPSLAASTRNPLHLLAGANDYRTVDIPFVSGANETGDAWLGIFKSFDGGQRWKTTLLPGYPQDTSTSGLSSPLHGYSAGADPIVRAGTNGLFYYTGLVFDRSADGTGRSAIFVSRFIDNNNQEAGDPILYLGASMIVTSPGGTGGVFLDKPWMTVDIPRDANTCSIMTTQTDPITGRKDVTQKVPAGPVYVAYTTFSTDSVGGRSDIYFATSANCGVTWSTPVRVNAATDRVNQGATMAVDPRNGDVYIAWRKFANPNDTTSSDGLQVARYNRTNRALLPPGLVKQLASEHLSNILEKISEKRNKTAMTATTSATPEDPLESFDQATTDVDSLISFRTNAYPTIAVDPTGRVYLAWSERGYAAARPLKTDGDARIVLSTSTDAASWTAPRVIADEAVGHQIMPTLTIGGNRLVLIYYDLRDDVSQIFGPFIDDYDSIHTATPKRHTLDLRASIGTLGASSVFTQSDRVSDYLTKQVLDANGNVKNVQMQYNAPNLPMFKQGTAPFIGDYVDIATAPAFVPGTNGTWTYNTGGQVLFHAAWTDNRDVRQPGFDANGDGNPWNDYTAPTARAGSGGTSPSIFDPTLKLPACNAFNSGSRNQNVYTARLSTGLIAGSPNNTKPLSSTLERAFSVFAQNTTSVTKIFRLTIMSQPLNGRASFDEFAAQPLTSIDVTTPARSMAARTVYATSSDPHAQIPVTVAEISSVGGASVPNGLSDTVVLNPDISNPDISNPDISNPDISNPDISNKEVFNPDISNPDISNPDISNPDISNPDISNPDISNPDISNPDISNPDISNVVVANPDISNPDISNPDISNPDISNPDISNPDISNPDISNTTLTDVSWTVTNNGNTSTSFNVNLFLAGETTKICSAGQTPTSNGCIATQLVLHKSYTTPATIGCVLAVQTQTVLVANIPNPRFVTPGTAAAAANDPSPSNATLWLAPGESARITLRIADPDTSDNASVGGKTIDPLFVPSTSGQGGGLTPFVVAQPVSTDSIGSGGTVSRQPASVFFVQQPTSADLGAAITPAVTVQVRDQLGMPLPGASVSMTLISPPAVPAVLTGGNAVTTDASGLATFAALTVSQAGMGFQLQATVANPTSSSSISNRSVSFSVGNETWSASGASGTVTLLDDGATGHPGMSYTDTSAPDGITQFNGRNGSWNMSTTALSAKTVNLSYVWSGFHSFFAVTAGLDAFVQRNGTDVSVVPLVNVGPTSCDPCRPPSGGFLYFGTTSVTVQAGDTFGFRLRGTNGDSRNELDGTFTASIDGTTALLGVSPSSIAPGDGFLVLRGVNMPVDRAVVTIGTTTADAFVFASPSSPSSAWIRLPLGFPTGNATVQLRSGDGTVATNSQPVLVSNTPGTPYITTVRDPSGTPITAVTAGQQITIVADGIDTLGAEVQFSQGTTTFPITSPSTTVSNTGYVGAVVTVPAVVAGGGPVYVYIRQGGGAFSTAFTLIAQ
jgi:uncharacterized protein YjbI with pentapeptide repeats